MPPDTWKDYMTERYGILPLTDVDRSRFQSLFAELLGPTPWGLESYSPLQTKTHSYSWQMFKRTSWVGLYRDELRDPVLVLGMYVHPVPLDNGIVGGWAPYEESSVTKGIELRSFRLDDLAPLSKGMKPLEAGYFSALAPPVDKIVFMNGLEDGVYETPAAGAFESCGEILLLCDNPAGSNDDAAVSIYSWLPVERQLHVYNLKWFNGRDYDLAYEWITDVVRDPVSNHILGRGFRLPQFELDDSNRSVLRWFWAYD
jgi:hypothetical protein